MTCRGRIRSVPTGALGCAPVGLTRGESCLDLSPFHDDAILAVPKALGNPAS